MVLKKYNTAVVIPIPTRISVSTLLDEGTLSPENRMVTKMHAPVTAGTTPKTTMPAARQQKLKTLCLLTTPMHGIAMDM